jgi:hypothetical protein
MSKGFICTFFNHSDGSTVSVDVSVAYSLLYNLLLGDTCPFDPVRTIKVWTQFFSLSAGLGRAAILCDRTDEQ